VLNLPIVGNHSSAFKAVVNGVLHPWHIAYPLVVRPVANISAQGHMLIVEMGMPVELLMDLIQDFAAPVDKPLVWIAMPCARGLDAILPAHHVGKGQFQFKDGEVDRPSA